MKPILKRSRDYLIYTSAGVFVVAAVVFFALQSRASGLTPISPRVRWLTWGILFCTMLLTQRAAWKQGKYWWSVGLYAVLIAVSVTLVNFAPRLWEAGLNYGAAAIGFVLFWILMKTAHEAAMKRTRNRS